MWFNPAFLPKEQIVQQMRHLAMSIPTDGSLDLSSETKVRFFNTSVDMKLVAPMAAQRLEALAARDDESRFSQVQDESDASSDDGEPASDEDNATAKGATRVDAFEAAPLDVARVTVGDMVPVLYDEEGLEDLQFLVGQVTQANKTQVEVHWFTPRPVTNPYRKWTPDFEHKERGKKWTPSTDFIDRACIIPIQLMWKEKEAFTPSKGGTLTPRCVRMIHAWLDDPDNWEEESVSDEEAAEELPGPAKKHKRSTS